jgi:hypothetical protein
MARVDIAGFGDIVDAPLKGRATVKITKAQNKTTTGGSPYLLLSLKVLDAETQESGLKPEGDIHNITLYYPNDSQKDGGKFCGREMRKMLDCFQAPSDESGFDTDDLVGLEGEVIFTNKKNEYNGEVRYDNTVSSWLKPTPATGAPAGNSWA